MRSRRRLGYRSLFGAPRGPSLQGLPCPGLGGAPGAPRLTLAFPLQYGVLLYQNFRIPPPRKALLPSFSTPVVSTAAASQRSAGGVRTGGRQEPERAVCGAPSLRGAGFVWSAV